MVSRDDAGAAAVPPVNQGRGAEVTTRALRMVGVTEHGTGLAETMGEGQAYTIDSNDDICYPLLCMI